MSAAEQLADSILRAAGSGLHNYTMAGTRKAIIDAASEAIRPPSIQRRVDACLFACCGIPTADLENGAVEDVIRALKGVMRILGSAESNASGNPEWDYVGPRVAACRAALAKLECDQ